MKLSLLSFFVLSVAAAASAEDINREFFGDYDAALVLYNRHSGKSINLYPARGSRRLTPCSTFKIYNTLIGLELGLLHHPDEPWYKWDGVHQEIEAWNQNLTLREAFRVSAVPAYQILARQIGLDRMKTFIKKIGYGNQDLSAGIDTFWLDRPKQSPILISANEQVALLNELLDGRLPFADQNVAVLKDIMRTTETKNGTLYGKTGSAISPEGKGTLGWFVGFVEAKETTHVFACNIMGGNSPSGKTARGIVEEILKSRGLL